jgi:hypothetical protein
MFSGLVGSGRRVGFGLAVAVLAWGAAPAAAQGRPDAGVEVLGVRAQGMGGAFVAVADDATAIYWNPAGLGTGDFVSLVLERSHVTLPDTPGDAPRLRTGAVLVGTPPLGAGYYRIGSTHYVPVTVVQSIGDHLNVGGAVKAVWGEGLDRRLHGRLDADLGVMVRSEGWRVGLVARNLAEPAFEANAVVAGGGAGAAVGDVPRLERQVRVGAAVFPRDGVILAVDADLTRQDTPDGARRAVAAGAEARPHARLLLRAGVRAQTVDRARPTASGGGSVALTALIWLDAQVTGGADTADRSWSLGLRARF